MFQRAHRDDLLVTFSAFKQLSLSRPHTDENDSASFPRVQVSTSMGTALWERCWAGRHKHRRHRVVCVVVATKCTCFHLCWLVRFPRDLDGWWVPESTTLAILMNKIRCVKVARIDGRAQFHADLNKNLDLAHLMWFTWYWVRLHWIKGDCWALAEIRTVQSSDTICQYWLGAGCNY